MQTFNNKKYNISNLKHFTTENAKYYGSIGGVESGKKRLLIKIQKTKLMICLSYSNLESYKSRNRLYNYEIDDIKDTIHSIKINKNRLNKLLKKYNQKYIC